MWWSTAVYICCACLLPACDNRCVQVSESRVLGRVLGANTRSFVFGTRVPKSDVPIFGALVKTKINHRNTTVYGLISDISVKDSGMTKMLSVSPDIRPEEIEWLRNQVVPIEARVLAVGYREPGGTMRHGLPAQPPITLDDVHDTSPDEVDAFTTRLDYLRLVLDAKDAPTDELLAAHIRLAAEVKRGRGPDFVLQAGRELTRLLAHDGARLEGLLRRITT